MTIEDAAGLGQGLMLIVVGWLIGSAIRGCIDNVRGNRSLKSAGLQAVWHDESSTSGYTRRLEIVKKEVE